MVVLLHLLILIYLTVVKCFQISAPSPQSKYLNYLNRSMSNKSSPLDYILTSLVKSCAGTFSILISHLIYLSFTQATFPSKFKLTLISPLLKKPGLPKSDLANFRLKSNLNTVGKILKRLALARFFLKFQYLPVFLIYSLPIANFILMKLLCSNSQMISLKLLTPEKLQISLLWSPSFLNSVFPQLVFPSTLEPFLWHTAEPSPKD